jgi:hypothetical protein
MDLNAILTQNSELISSILGVLLVLVANYFGFKLPFQKPVTPVDPSKPVDPVKPEPNKDPLAGLPGLPGHPLLNIILPFFLKNLGIGIPFGVQELPDDISNHLAVASVAQIFKKDAVLKEKLLKELADK